MAVSAPFTELESQTTLNVKPESQHPPESADLRLAPTDWLDHEIAKRQDYDEMRRES